MLKIYAHSDKFKAKDKKALTLLAVNVVLVYLPKMFAFNSQQRNNDGASTSVVQGGQIKNKNKKL